MASRLVRLVRLARQPPAFPQHPSTAPAVRPLVRHAASKAGSPFASTPSPPRLPPDQQAEFERLQRVAGTQEGFNPASTPDLTSPLSPSGASSEASPPPLPLRKGAPPEFEGDVNPKTGEVGGPKNEPLRWGPAGDYSFNGRVTDF